MLYGFHAPGVREGLQAADTRGELNIVHWIGAGDSRRFDEDIVRWHLGELTPYPDFELPEGLFSRVLSLCSPQLPVAIDQLSRNPAMIGSTIADYRSLFQLLVKRFTRLLVGKNVDCVFFQNLPHEGFEYVLYLVARALRIDTVLAYQSVLPNRFFYCRTLEDFGHFDSASSRDEPRRYILERKFEKELFYVDQSNTKSNARLTDVLSQWANRCKLNVRAFCQRVKEKSGYYRLKNRDGDGKKHHHDPGREYERLISLHSKQNVDFSKPYVYFPLHLQPELTTSAIGDKYTDQLLALERLRSFVPSDWWIYVKENPKQTHKQRDPAFFERLCALRNTILVDRRVNTYDLLEHSQFCSTITGTVGWEAITGGKSVLVFGRPWYLRLPGVFHIDRAPDARTIANARYTHSHLQMEFDKLYSLSRDGLVDIAYQRSINRFDTEKNSQLILEFVTDQLTGKKVRKCA